MCRAFMKYAIPYTGEVVYASLGRHWSSRLSQMATGKMKNLCLNILEFELSFVPCIRSGSSRGILAILDEIESLKILLSYLKVKSLTLDTFCGK